LAGPAVDSGSAALRSLEANCASARVPRVLVVDDNPVNRLLAGEMLSLWGILPMQAADGAEAVALACGHEFDLILMDLQMPVLDGLEATAQIRRFERQNALPRASVVAFTSSPFSGSEPVLRACGLDAVLHKPCDAATLHACLRRWCIPLQAEVTGMSQHRPQGAVP
jgi:CheY-like chemotaxis protein